MTKNLRKLIIKNKLTGKCQEIMMDQHSIILFSVATNQQFQHKIILEDTKCKNLWLGVTFRLSKTLIRFHDKLPYFVSNNKLLLLANEQQRKDFCKNKGLENSNIDFTYPDVDFSISAGDFIPLD